MKDLRDARVVKQQFDFSCGAAALATMLRYGFGDEVSDRQILNDLFTGLSDDDRRTVEQTGFRCSTCIGVIQPAIRPDVRAGQRVLHRAVCHGGIERAGAELHDGRDAAARVLRVCGCEMCERCD
jgi:hypothetical protein